jgi:hypothetical protein
MRKLVKRTKGGKYRTTDTFPQQTQNHLALLISRHGATRELQYKTTRGFSMNPERRPAGVVSRDYDLIDNWITRPCFK